MFILSFQLQHELSERMNRKIFTPFIFRGAFKLACFKAQTSRTANLPKCEGKNFFDNNCKNV